MYKVLSMIKRPADMSFEDFRHWATIDHPKLAKQIPGLVKYIVNLADNDSSENVYDAVNALFFETESDFHVGFGSAQGKAAGADAAKHAGIRHRLVVEENQLL